MKKYLQQTIILDFDNTLYDWVAQWYQAFSVLISETHRISGVPIDALKKEIRPIHQRHHTSEYAFLLQELEIIRDGTIEATLQKFKPAIDRSRAARKEYLTLYPDVMSTLLDLKSSGKTLAVFTESQSFYTVMRFKRLGLEGVIDFLFTSEDHEVPDDETLSNLRTHPGEYYAIKSTKHRSVGKGRLKPDPEILQQIIEEIGSTKSDSIYIGDSLYKDVLMANQALIPGIWAEYGEARGQPGYDLLREVSHWTDEDVERDRKLKDKDVVPDRSLKQKFSEILLVTE